MDVLKIDYNKILDAYINISFKEQLILNKEMLTFFDGKINYKFGIYFFLKRVDNYLKKSKSVLDTILVYYRDKSYGGVDFYKLKNIDRDLKNKILFDYLYQNNASFRINFLSNINGNNNHYFLKGLSFVGLFLVFVILTVYSGLELICYGPSERARNIFVSTFLETGALKFAPSLVMSDEEIEEIVKANSLPELNEEVDTSKISTDDNQRDDIEIVKVYGNNYFGTMMIVHDPSRVKLATTYPFSKYGKELNTLVEENDAIAGVNGGLYESLGNKGGYPVGVVVADGQVQFNNPYGAGYHLIGFDKSNVLRIISIENMSTNDVYDLVTKEQIRDAVTFQEEFSDSNNHFVKLIINGESRKTIGLGSGANPRTAIGQRADGSVLFFVTDGRGTSGHLGATASDLIEVMSKYGAVNAANIDGGSSSSMYYNGEYLMTSVTLYYNNSSWRLPDAFIVTK